ncbi:MULTISPECIES: hypothetical protein [Mesorhizobium]|uniref:hypothetical protein n=1 Tax=Mesorhizobium TaxID=68287 RepID=UPI0013155EC3|nr:MULTISPECIES: hypothetical protein [Mesorhizobium]
MSNESANEFFAAQPSRVMGDESLSDSFGFRTLIGDAAKQTELIQRFPEQR